MNRVEQAQASDPCWSVTPLSPNRHHSGGCSRLHDIQCALVKVDDRYGDHGYAGFYAVRSGVELIHFCFSCRILGMGIETWLYNRLRRPALTINGAVLSDPKSDKRSIDTTFKVPPAVQTQLPAKATKRWTSLFPVISVMRPRFTS